MTVRHHKTCDVMFDWADIVNNVVCTYRDSLIDYRNKVNQLISYEFMHILSDQCHHKLSWTFCHKDSLIYIDKTLSQDLCRI